MVRDLSECEGVFGTEQPERLRWCYFLRGGDVVKIGLTRDVRRRMQQLQVACPHRLEFLGAICTDSAGEREFHRMFAKERATGEWFRATDALLSIVWLLVFVEGNTGAYSVIEPEMDWPIPRIAREVWLGEEATCQPN